MARIKGKRYANDGNFRSLTANFTYRDTARNDPSGIRIDLTEFRKKGKIVSVDKTIRITFREAEHLVNRLLVLLGGDSRTNFT
jgi:hypothetical protein